MQSFSFLSIDIGFDLRVTGHELARPGSIGYPGETVEVIFEGGRKVGRACDCGAALRRAGYKVAPGWFAGRESWGQPVVITTATEEQELFRLAGVLPVAKPVIPGPDVVDD